MKWLSRLKFTIRAHNSGAIVHKSGDLIQCNEKKYIKTYYYTNTLTPLWIHISGAPVVASFYISIKIRSKVYDE